MEFHLLNVRVIMCMYFVCHYECIYVCTYKILYRVILRVLLVQWYLVLPAASDVHRLLNWFPTPPPDSEEDDQKPSRIKNKACQKAN